MGAFVFLMIIALFFVLPLVLKASGRAAQLGGYDRLASRGLRGRALVLTAWSMAPGVTIGARRFERRQMTLDVEVEGRPPYEVSGQFLVPRGVVEPIPGASLDVAVDPGNPSNLVVLGPGGFTGPWLNLGAPQPY